MVLKSYFDGSNHADSSEYDRMSVGTVCGSSRQWRGFDRAWNKVLYKHRATHLHTTDAVSLQNDFAVKKGWNKKRVDAFVGECVEVIGKHMAIPPGVPGRRPKMGLYPVTLTIPFGDWLRAIEAVPELPKDIHGMFANECMSYAFKWGRRVSAQKYELYFDRSEHFRGHIDTMWRHPKAQKEIEMMQDVIHVGDSISSEVPAMQMADLFAWSANHANQEKRLWHITLNYLPWTSRLLDYEHLVKPSHKALERIASWNLPPRRSSVKNLSKPKKDRVR